MDPYLFVLVTRRVPLLPPVPTHDPLTRPFDMTTVLILVVGRATMKGPPQSDDLDRAPSHGHAPRLMILATDPPLGCAISIAVASLEELLVEEYLG